MTRSIRTYADLEDSPSPDLPEQIDAQMARLARRLASVRHVVVVASGKGGVGKSFVTANLAAGLAARGWQVGALDADVHGPSLAVMLGAARAPLRVDEDGVHPAQGAHGCRVMSTDLLLASPDAPVRWREPAVGGFIWQSALETGVFREFLADVAWGELDCLLVDLPPGTDKIARALTLLPTPSAMIVVTTPSPVARAVVQRSLTYARDADIAALGTVVNMDGYVCTSCGSRQELFDPAGRTARVASGDDPAARTGRTASGDVAAFPAARAASGDDGADAPPRDDVPVWGSIPFDRALSDGTEQGRPFSAGGAAGEAFVALAKRVVSELEGP